MFFALKGAQFNGNRYAVQALEQGASYAVIDEEHGSDVKFIKVPDVLRYFQSVANMQRRAFSIPVIAIAGSNGKTTTKNLVERVLSKKYRTHVTQGNFNNHIGVPMTLLDMPQDTEIAVVEIGTNHPGEILELCRILEPNYGLITNIGKEHLEGFGSLEAVAREESELYLYLHRNEGTAFVRSEDDWLMRMSASLENKLYYSSLDLELNSLVPFIRFRYEGVPCQTQLMGSYNLHNILAALAIGKHFGVEPADAVEAISSYSPDNNRSQWVRGGSNEILLDAYNANPSSMELAIDLIGSMPQEQKVLILGDMFEMGKAADQEHQALLEFIEQAGFKEVHLLGGHFKKAAERTEFSVYNDMDALQRALVRKKYRNSAILIKGSRGMRMEEAVSALQDS